MPLQSRRANRTVRRPPQALQRPPGSASWRPHQEAPPDPALRPSTLGHYRLRPTRAAAVRHRGRPASWCRSPARWAASRAMKPTTRAGMSSSEERQQPLPGRLYGREPAQAESWSVASRDRSAAPRPRVARPFARRWRRPGEWSPRTPCRGELQRLGSASATSKVGRSMSAGRCLLSDERSARTPAVRPAGHQLAVRGQRPKRTPAIWPPEVLVALADTHLADRRHPAHLLGGRYAGTPGRRRGRARLSSKRREENAWGVEDRSERREMDELRGGWKGSGEGGR